MAPGRVLLEGPERREYSTGSACFSSVSFRSPMVQRLSKRSTAELDALATALVRRLQTSPLPGNSLLPLAAGTTRLGKIEFLKGPSRLESRPTEGLLGFTETGLLIRIRQQRYTSAGIVESPSTGNASTIQLHLEHQSGYAKSLRIPFRVKRPQFFSVGSGITQTAAPKWFLSPWRRD